MKKIFSIVLALLTLATNIGLAVNVHYCGGELAEANLSIGIDPAGCGMEAMETEMLPADACVSSTSCCKDQNQMIQMDENVRLQAASFVHFTPVWLVQPIITTVPVANEVFGKAHFVAHSPPTLPDRDLLVLHQVFLI
ncbi:MAG: hypothetical protein GC180_05350 [Bacteroidetes bacterium]|nr:hypothetical protein [Bacteroidota bacterium]